MLKSLYIISKGGETVTKQFYCSDNSKLTA